MKKTRLNAKDKELISSAKDTIIKSYRRNTKTSTTVGSALLTENNIVYSGVNIEVFSSQPTSICAETGAIAAMMTNNENKIETIVTIWLNKDRKNNWDIIPPCGSCRHFISQFGNPYIIIDKKHKVKLNELYPLSGR